jgi:hypothetical protein
MAMVTATSSLSALAHFCGLVRHLPRSEKCQQSDTNGVSFDPSSARSRHDSGIVSPSVLAIWRLMTSPVFGWHFDRQLAW